MCADADGFIAIRIENGGEIRAKVPSYKRPDVRKNVSGYFNTPPLDAIDIFIGSEGTLGVIAEIELALLPKPEGFFSGVVFFEKESDLVALIDETRALSFASRRGNKTGNPFVTARDTDTGF